MKSIKGKILTGFAIVMVLLVMMAAYSYYSIYSLSQEVEQIIEDDMVFLESANLMSFSVASRAKLTHDFVLFNRKEFKEQFISETIAVDEVEKRLYDAIGSGRISVRIEEALQVAEEKTTKWESLVNEEIIPLYDSGNRDRAMKIMEEKSLPYSQDAVDAWVKVAKIQNSITKGQTSILKSSANQSKLIMIVAALSGIVLAIIIALYIANTISKSISLVVNRLESIARGDLRGDALKVKSKDETGRLITASNIMITNLKSLMEKITETSNQVAASSQQFAASAEQSSASAEQVTTAIQEIARGAETSSERAKESVQGTDKMSLGTDRIVDSSSDAAQESQNTIEQANEGNTLIQKAVSQMKSIQSSVVTSSQLVSKLGDRSLEIGQIVEVITGIANQTNLLALNAAIEASRAGEHGRGFAVVADEVRKLAEESKKSADQITELISQIQNDTNSVMDSMTQGKKEVEFGTGVISEAGLAFERILSSIQLVSKKIEEVSTSAVQAAASSQQVNTTVEELSEIAQSTSHNSQNVATAAHEQLATMQEVATSATALTLLAEELQEELRKFTF